MVREKVYSKGQHSLRHKHSQGNGGIRGNPVERNRGSLALLAEACVCTYNVLLGASPRRAMSDPTRREFLKSTTAAVAAGAMMRGTTAASEAESKPPQAASSGSIPPHRELPIDGVHAYTDKLSVHAGESIRFHLSGTLPYEFQVCRLGTDVDSPREDEVLQSWRVNDPIMQPIHPGSYIEVEKGLSAENPIHAMTLECWIRLWNLPERQGVITQLDPKRPDGYGLLVEPDGSVVFFLGGGPKDVDATHRTVHSTGPGLLSKPGKKGDFTMPPAHWHHVVATFNGTHKAIFVDGRRVGRWKVGGGGRVGDCAGPTAARRRLRSRWSGGRFS